MFNGRRVSKRPRRPRRRNGSGTTWAASVTMAKGTTRKGRRAEAIAAQRMPRVRCTAGRDDAHNEEHAAPTANSGQEKWRE